MNTDEKGRAYYGSRGGPEGVRLARRQRLGGWRASARERTAGGAAALPIVTAAAAAAVAIAVALVAAAAPVTGGVLPAPAAAPTAQEGGSAAVAARLSGRQVVAGRGDDHGGAAVDDEWIDRPENDGDLIVPRADDGIGGVAPLRACAGGHADASRDGDDPAASDSAEEAAASQVPEDPAASADAEELEASPDAGTSAARSVPAAPFGDIPPLLRPLLTDNADCRAAGIPCPPPAECRAAVVRNRDFNDLWVVLRCIPPSPAPVRGVRPGELGGQWRPSPGPPCVPPLYADRSGVCMAEAGEGGACGGGGDRLDTVCRRGKEVTARAGGVGGTRLVCADAASGEVCPLYGWLSDAAVCPSGAGVCRPARVGDLCDHPENGFGDTICPANTGCLGRRAWPGTPTMELRRCTPVRPLGAACNVSAGDVCGPWDGSIFQTPPLCVGGVCVSDDDRTTTALCARRGDACGSAAETCADGTFCSTVVAPRDGTAVCAVEQAAAGSLCGVNVWGTCSDYLFQCVDGVCAQRPPLPAGAICTVSVDDCAPPAVCRRLRLAPGVAEDVVNVAVCALPAAAVAEP